MLKSPHALAAAKWAAHITAESHSFLAFFTAQPGATFLTTPSRTCPSAQA